MANYLVTILVRLFTTRGGLHFLYTRSNRGCPFPSIVGALQMRTRICDQGDPVGGKPVSVTSGTPKVKPWLFVTMAILRSLSLQSFREALFFGVSPRIRPDLCSDVQKIENFHEYELTVNAWDHPLSTTLDENQAAVLTENTSVGTEN